MSEFDLTPPSPAQRQQLIDGLNSEERRVLLEHGTEAAFCGVFLDNKLRGRLHLPPVRTAVVPFQRQVRFRHRLAEFLPALRRVAREDDTRHQLRHDPDRDRMRALRQPPGPRIPGWPAADRRAPLPQFGVAGLRRAGRAAAGSAATRRRGSTDGDWPLDSDLRTDCMNMQQPRTRRSRRLPRNAGSREQNHAPAPRRPPHETRSPA